MVMVVSLLITGSDWKKKRENEEEEEEEMITNSRDDDRISLPFHFFFPV